MQKPPLTRQGRCRGKLGKTTTLPKINSVNLTWRNGIPQHVIDAIQIKVVDV
jgi:hypothetical protein